MRFIGRFSLHAANPTKSPHCSLDNKGQPDYSKGYDMVPSVTLTLNAVKDGSPADVLFGQATPYGKIEMNIQNPDVALPIIDLWNEWVHSTKDLQAGRSPLSCPKFEVEFHLLEEGA